MRPELKEVGDQLIASVRGYVARATRPLAERLDRHDRSATSTGELLADLDERLAAVERRLAALEAQR